MSNFKNIFTIGGDSSTDPSTYIVNADDKVEPKFNRKQAKGSSSSASSRNQGVEELCDYV